MEYSFWSLIAGATLTVKLIMALLTLMSLSSWAIIFGKWISLGSAARKARTGHERFERARDLREAVQGLGSEAGASEAVVVDNVRRALSQGVGQEMSRLNAALAFLATVANAAPFIGLFGTVWGIMHSFHAIGLMKSASLATVAPGISEALIATAIGLVVAIPASVAYNLFLGKLGGIETRLVNFAGTFLNRVQRELNAQSARAATRQGA